MPILFRDYSFRYTLTFSVEFSSNTKIKFYEEFLTESQIRVLISVAVNTCKIPFLGFYPLIANGSDDPIITRLTHDILVIDGFNIYKRTPCK